MCLAPKASFSQEAEDIIMRNWLPENSGEFLDIGSGLPIWGSNSYLFYKLGWRGTCVDALGKNIKFAKMFRPGDRSIQALVGGATGKSQFWEFDSYEYSTADEDQARIVMQSARFTSGDVRLVKTSQFNMHTLAIPCTSG
jgi:hypothetical protein